MATIHTIPAKRRAIIAGNYLRRDTIDAFKLIKRVGGSAACARTMDDRIIGLCAIYEREYGPEALGALFALIEAMADDPRSGVAQR